MYLQRTVCYFQPFPLSSLFQRFVNDSESLRATASNVSLDISVNLSARTKALVKNIFNIQDTYFNVWWMLTYWLLIIHHFCSFVDLYDNFFWKSSAGNVVVLFSLLLGSYFHGFIAKTND